MTPAFMILIAAALFAMVAGFTWLDRRDKQEAERRRKQRERDERNRRAYDLNRKTRWNG